jgi:hypothetical protein
MGVKRPLRPEVAQRYGRELSVAEQLKNDPNAYGDPNMQFDPLVEMEVLRQANVTDQSFLEASMNQWKQEGIEIPEAPVARPMDPRPKMQPRPPVQPEPQLEEEEEAFEEEEEVMPTNPIEKMKWVAEKLKEVNPNAPGASELMSWKQMHGNVFVLQLGEDIYIYRYIKRQEWSQMMANPAVQKMRPEQVEDMIVEKCLMFPKLTPERKAFLPAGAVGMLAEQIRLQSQFLDPMQVANITVKL